MGFFTELFAWWTGNTIGTRLYTWRKGERVGEDGLGNVYYRERGGTRRWVIYRSLAEPSQVPPAWHAWLHYTVDVPPTEEDYTPQAMGAGASSEPHRDLRGLPPARLDAPHRTRRSRRWITSRGSPNERNRRRSTLRRPSRCSAGRRRTTPRTAASCRSLPGPCSACSPPSPASASSISAAATAR